MYPKHRLSILAATLAAAAFSAPALAAPVVFTATLSGANEAPANASPATGLVTVTFDIVAHTMRVVTSFSGLLGNTTAAHIHCCSVTAGTGTAGVATATPSFVGFPTGVTAGSMDMTYDMTLAGSYNATYVTANGGTTAAAEQALFNGIASGKAYFNIHTASFGGGEIRGFLTAAVPEPASLALALTGLGALAAGRRRKVAG